MKIELTMTELLLIIDMIKNGMSKTTREMTSTLCRTSLMERMTLNQKRNENTDSRVDG